MLFLVFVLVKLEVCKNWNSFTILIINNELICFNLILMLSLCQIIMIP